MKQIYCASVVLIAAATLTATAPALSRRNFAANCTTPVSRNDTAATILNRYGAQARRETLPGAEGETFPGVVLYPRDRLRRVEIGLGDGEGIAQHLQGLRRLRRAIDVWWIASACLLLLEKIKPWNPDSWVSSAGYRCLGRRSHCRGRPPGSPRMQPVHCSNNAH